MSSIENYIEKALSHLKEKSRNINLKAEQEEGIKDLLLGKDVLAVLPTGFGKSMIFTVYALAKREMDGRRVSIVVISPLKSIINDQVAEMLSIDCTAVELTDDTIEEVLINPPQFVYATAEQILEERFLDALKDHNSMIHNSISAIIVDESHTVETWTGKRKVKGKSGKESAFREAYGRISILRSMCKEGAPLLALTGTADSETQKTICSELVMRNPTKLFVSPNRVNLKFTVSKVKKADMFKQVDWIIKMVKEKGINTPKTIIFCSTLASIAGLVNWLMMKLGCQAFHPTTSKKREDCLIGIFHSLSLSQYKERITESLKQNGVKRIVVATTALSMGVNFPDIRNIVMWGPARTILDFHQEAGRAGRDGLPSEVILCYYGQQVTHCEDEVRSFLKSIGCLRVAAYSSLDPQITPLQPLHDCCSFCSLSCDCESGGCSKPKSQYENQGSVEPLLPTKSRVVTGEDKAVVVEALNELKNSLNSSAPIRAFGSTAPHGFSNELIADVADNCDKIFSLENVLTFVPVYSLRHAVMILEIINDLFDDCDQTVPESLSKSCESTTDQDFNQDNDVYFLLNSEYGIDCLEDTGDLDFI